MAEPDDTRRKRRRWVGPLLVISLGLNLLVAGAAVGLIVKWRSLPFVAGQHIFGAAGLGVLSGALDDHYKREIGTELRERGHSLGRQRDKANTEALVLIELLRADPFLPEALEGFFRDQRENATEMLEEGHNLLAPRIIGMTSDERNEYADRIEGRLGKRGKWHHGGDRR